MNEDHRIGCAYHEAGHAVVANALGLKIGRIEIAIDGDDAKGGCDIEAEQSHLSIIDKIAICAAGIEAQLLFDAPTHEYAGLSDHGKIRELVSNLADHEGDAIRELGHSRARDLLIIQTDQVQTIVKILMKTGRIAGEEADALFKAR